MEQLAFELVEKYGAAELEKLAKYLELLVFGKKSLEAQVNSDDDDDKPAPATRAASSKAKPAKGTQAASSDDDEQPF